MTHPFLENIRPTLHISHRGGAALAPENTMEAFESAVSRHGTQMLELDVHVTRDGVVVVAHDETVDRCTEGTGAIASMGWEEVARLDAGHRFTVDGGRTFPYRGKDVRIPRLAIVGGLLFVMAIHFPTKFKLARWLEDQQRLLS